MKLGKKLVEFITEGLKGSNKGLSIGLPVLGKTINNLQRGQIVLTLAGTGTGKSLFTMHHLGVEPLWDYYTNHRKDPNYIFKWIVYSFEMDLESLLARIASYILFKDYSIECAPAAILSYGEKKLDEKILNIIIEHIEPALDQLSDFVEVNGKRTPSQIEARLTDFYEEYGEFVKDKYGATTSYKTDKYIFCNVTIDHVALVKGDSGKKSKIDELGEKMNQFVTLCKTTFTPVQQLNRAEGDVTKLTKMETPKPSLSEAKDSGDLVDLSHVIIALFNPHRFDIKAYLDVDISLTPSGLKDAYRAIFVLKARGSVVGMVHTAFYGAAGFFKEFKVSELTTNDRLKIKSGTKFWK